MGKRERRGRLGNENHADSEDALNKRSTPAQPGSGSLMNQPVWGYLVYISAIKMCFVPDNPIQPGKRLALRDEHRNKMGYRVDCMARNDLHNPIWKSVLETYQTILQNLSKQLLAQYKYFNPHYENLVLEFPASTL